MYILDQKKYIYATGALAFSMIGLTKVRDYAKAAEIENLTIATEKLENIILFVTAEALLKGVGKNTRSWPRFGITSLMVGLPLIAFKDLRCFKAISSLVITMIMGKHACDEINFQ